MAKLYNISDWNTLPWFSTGGTRDKKYIQSPEGKYYYFKTSLFKPDKDYRFEFWSEIIAYEIGSHLGFDILKYDIAIDNDKIGCLCESMMDAEKEEFIEGIKYLQAVDNSFNPEDVKLRNQYSFQLIEKAFKELNYEKYLNSLIETIVFDSLIGNGDRHQENWAFISNFTLLGKAIAEIQEGTALEKMPRYWRRIVEKLYFKKGTRILKPEIAKVRLPSDGRVKFAPIYDSGSSLGRELNEDRINKLLSNTSEFDSYINRGKCEIHWEREKLTHFEIIEKLKNKHQKEIYSIIRRIVDRWDLDAFKRMIEVVDCEVPEKFESYKLPANRKTFIVKALTLRFERLKSLMR